MLQAEFLHVHFDPAKPIILACDASQYEIGAVLSHILEDGQDRPVAYVSRTQSPAEKQYSQLKRKSLAIVCAVKKRHNYIYEWHLQNESDHHPLMYLFGETKGMSQMASSHMQRWALTN